MTQPAKIIPFAFEDHLVRVHKPNGEPWFVGRDVCRVLEIKNESQAMGRLDADERQDGVCITDPTGRVQEVVVISEPGVFRLIFTSRKPEAERFKRFLAHEVLPALRKQGSYTLPDADAPVPETRGGEFPPGAATLSEYTAKLETARLALRIHGRRAAAQLWSRLGLPSISDSVLDEMDEGRRCLAHLLNLPANEITEFKGFETLRQVIDACLEDNDLKLAQELNDRYHLLVVHEGDGALFVPNYASELFVGTPWSMGRHRRALRLIREATPDRRTVGAQMRGTLIPAVVLDSVPLPLPTGPNVVPLKS